MFLHGEEQQKRRERVRGRGGEARHSLSLFQPCSLRPENKNIKTLQSFFQADELEKKLVYITQNVPTIVSNVQGSAAGAGSGTFHTYANGRRREAERIGRMEREARERAAKEEMEVRRGSRLMFPFLVRKRTREREGGGGGRREEREREREREQETGSSALERKEKRLIPPFVLSPPPFSFPVPLYQQQDRLSNMQNIEQEKTAKRRLKRQKQKVS